MKRRELRALGRGVDDDERDAIGIEVVRQARGRQHGGHALREGVGGDGGDEAGLARALIAHHHHLTARPPLARHRGETDEARKRERAGASGAAAAALRLASERAAASGATM